MGLSEFVDKIGIELEGGWDNIKTRFSVLSSCDHSCDSDCEREDCQHNCEDDCWHHSCIHDCTISSCEDNCGHTCGTPSYSNRCFSYDCYHDCDSNCYVNDCCHDCEDGGCDCTIPGFHYDGSVSGTGCELEGEIVSPPIDNWNTLKTWLDVNHPDKVNSSCGTHMHISVLDYKDYDRLMLPEFYPFIISKIEAWGRQENFKETNHFWHRLQGHNDYCCANDASSCSHGRNVHDADTQAAARQKDSCRYAHVNFCRNQHGTVEFRVFHGMKTPDLIKRGAEALVSGINEYLQTARANEITQLDTAVEVDDELIQEFSDQIIEDNHTAEIEDFVVSTSLFKGLKSVLNPSIASKALNLNNRQLGALSSARILAVQAIKNRSKTVGLTASQYRAIKTVLHRSKGIDFREFESYIEVDTAKLWEKVNKQVKTFSNYNLFKDIYKSWVYDSYRSEEWDNLTRLRNTLSHTLSSNSFKHSSTLISPEEMRIILLADQEILAYTA